MRKLKICSVVLLPTLKPACSSAMIFFTGGFNLFSMIFRMTLLGCLMRLIVRLHCCWLPFLGSVMTKDWVHGVGHSPACQILLQIVVRAVITSSPPAWTSSAGIFCRLQLTFLFSMIVLQPQRLCEGWGGHPLWLSGDSSVLMDLHWPCSCTAQSRN